MNLNVLDDAWIPSACTLPTEARPLRVGDFDDFFIRDALSLARTSAETLTITVRPDPEAAGRAARLAVKETSCCSFFRFDLSVAQGEVALAVSASREHADVLAALGDRAERLIADACQ